MAETYPFETDVASEPANPSPQQTWEQRNAARYEPVTPEELAAMGLTGTMDLGDLLRAEKAAVAAIPRGGVSATDQFLTRYHDVGLSARKGFGALGTAVVGLFSDDLARAAKAENERNIDANFSQEHREAQQAWVDAPGTVGGTLAAVRDNPSLASSAILESIPSMAAAAATGGGTVVAGRGLVTLGGRAGTTAVGRGLTAVGTVASNPAIGAAVGEGSVAGVLVAENFRQKNDALGTGDRSLTSGQLAAVAGISTAVGAIGYGGARLAEKWGLANPDILSILSAPIKNQRSWIARVTGGMITEGLLEELPQSLIETMITNIADGRPIDEGLVKSGVMGTVVGAAMGAGVNAASRTPNTNTLVAKPEIVAAAAAAAAAPPVVAPPVVAPPVVAPPVAAPPVAAPPVAAPPVAAPPVAAPPVAAPPVAAPPVAAYTPAVQAKIEAILSEMDNPATSEARVGTLRTELRAVQAAAATEAKATPDKGAPVAALEAEVAPAPVAAPVAETGAKGKPVAQMTPEEHAKHIVQVNGMDPKDVTGFTPDGMPITAAGSPSARTVSGTRGTINDAIAGGQPINAALLDGYNKESSRPIALPEGWTQRGDLWHPPTPATSKPTPAAEAAPATLPVVKGVPVAAPVKVPRVTKAAKVKAAAEAKAIADKAIADKAVADKAAAEAKAAEAAAAEAKALADKAAAAKAAEGEYGTSSTGKFSENLKPLKNEDGTPVLTAEDEANLRAGWEKVQAEAKTLLDKTRADLRYMEAAATLLSTLPQVRSRVFDMMGVSLPRSVIAPPEGQSTPGKLLSSGYGIANLGGESVLWLDVIGFQTMVDVVASRGGKRGLEAAAKATFLMATEEAFHSYITPALVKLQVESGKSESEFYSTMLENIPAKDRERFQSHISNANRGVALTEAQVLLNQKLVVDEWIRALLQARSKVGKMGKITEQVTQGEGFGAEDLVSGLLAVDLRGSKVNKEVLLSSSVSNLLQNVRDLFRSKDQALENPVAKAANALLIQAVDATLLSIEGAQKKGKIPGKAGKVTSRIPGIPKIVPSTPSAVEMTNKINAAKRAIAAEKNKHNEPPVEDTSDDGESYSKSLVSLTELQQKLSDLTAADSSHAANFIHSGLGSFLDEAGFQLNDSGLVSTEIQGIQFLINGEKGKIWKTLKRIMELRKQADSEEGDSKESIKEEAEDLLKEVMGKYAARVKQIAKGIVAAKVLNDVSQLHQYNPNYGLRVADPQYITGGVEFGKNGVIQKGSVEKHISKWEKAKERIENQNDPAKVKRINTYIEQLREQIRTGVISTNNPLAPGSQTELGDTLAKPDPNEGVWNLTRKDRPDSKKGLSAGLMAVTVRILRGYAKGPLLGLKGNKFADPVDDTLEKVHGILEEASEITDSTDPSYDVLVKAHAGVALFFNGTGEAGVKLYNHLMAAFGNLESKAKQEALEKANANLRFFMAKEEALQDEVAVIKSSKDFASESARVYGIKAKGFSDKVAASASLAKQIAELGPDADPALKKSLTQKLKALEGASEALELAAKDAKASEAQVEIRDARLVAKLAELSQASRNRAEASRSIRDVHGKFRVSSQAAEAAGKERIENLLIEIENNEGDINYREVRSLLAVLDDSVAGNALPGTRASTWSLPVTSEQDAAYLAAVKAGDTATAQRMVDEAAKAREDSVRSTENRMKSEFYRIAKEKGDNSPEAEAAYEAYFPWSQHLRDVEADTLHPNQTRVRLTPILEQFQTKHSDGFDQARMRWDKRGEKVMDSEDLGGVFKATGSGVLFRGVSLEDYNRIKKSGFIDTDFRGAITNKEGINLTPDTRTAATYLPTESEGIIIAINTDGLPLYNIGADSYIRSFEKIPADRIIDTSVIFYKPKDGGIYYTPDRGPITRDDQGNVIPLSQRFNTGSEDIRRSLPVTQDIRVHPDIRANSKGELPLEEFVASIQQVLDDKLAWLLRAASGNVQLVTEDGGSQTVSANLLSAQFAAAKKRLVEIQAAYEAAYAKRFNGRPEEALAFNLKDAESRMGELLAPEIVEEFKSVSGRVAEEELARSVAKAKDRLEDVGASLEFWRSVPIKSNGSATSKEDAEDNDLSVSEGDSAHIIKLLSTEEEQLSNYVGKQTPATIERADQVRATKESSEDRAAASMALVDPRLLWLRTSGELKMLSSPSTAQGQSVLGAGPDVISGLDTSVASGPIRTPVTEDIASTIASVMAARFSNPQALDIVELSRFFIHLDAMRRNAYDNLEDRGGKLEEAIAALKAKILEGAAAAADTKIDIKNALRAAKPAKGISRAAMVEADFEWLESRVGAIELFVKMLDESLRESGFSGVAGDVITFLLSPEQAQSGVTPEILAEYYHELSGVAKDDLKVLFKIISRQPEAKNVIRRSVSKGQDGIISANLEELQTAASDKALIDPAAFTKEDPRHQEARAKYTAAVASRDKAVKKTLTSLQSASSTSDTDLKKLRSNLSGMLIRLQALKNVADVFESVHSDPGLNKIRIRVETSESAFSRGRLIFRNEKNKLLEFTGFNLPKSYLGEAIAQPTFVQDYSGTSLERATQSKAYFDNLHLYLERYAVATVNFVQDPTLPSPATLGFDARLVNSMEVAKQLDKGAHVSPELFNVDLASGLQEFPDKVQTVWNWFQAADFWGGISGKTWDVLSTLADNLPTSAGGLALQAAVGRFASALQDASGSLAIRVSPPRKGSETKVREGILALAYKAAKSHKGINDLLSYKLEVYDQMGPLARQQHSDLKVGTFLPLSGRFVTQEDMDYLKADSEYTSHSYQQVQKRADVATVETIRGVKYSRKAAVNWKYPITQFSGNERRSEFLTSISKILGIPADPERARISKSPKDNVASEDAKEFWNSQTQIFKSHILDSITHEEAKSAVPRDPRMLKAQIALAKRWYDEGEGSGIGSITDVDKAVQAIFDNDPKGLTLTQVRDFFYKELDFIASRALSEGSSLRPDSDGVSKDSYNSQQSVDDNNQFRKPQAPRSLPSVLYSYGTVTDADYARLYRAITSHATIELGQSLDAAIAQVQEMLKDTTLPRFREAFSSKFEAERLLVRLNAMRDNFNKHIAGVQDRPGFLTRSFNAFVTTLLAGTTVGIGNLFLGPVASSVAHLRYDTASDRYFVADIGRALGRGTKALGKSLGLVARGSLTFVVEKAWSKAGFAGSAYPVLRHVKTLLDLEQVERGKMSGIGMSSRRPLMVELAEMWRTMDMAQTPEEARELVAEGSRYFSLEAWLKVSGMAPLAIRAFMSKIGTAAMDPRVNQSVLPMIDLLQATYKPIALRYVTRLLNKNPSLNGKVKGLGHRFDAADPKQAVTFQDFSELNTEVTSDVKIRQLRKLLRSMDGISLEEMLIDYAERAEVNPDAGFFSEDLLRIYVQRMLSHMNTPTMANRPLAWAVNKELGDHYVLLGFGVYQLQSLVSAPTRVRRTLQMRDDPSQKNSVFDLQSMKYVLGAGLMLTLFGSIAGGARELWRRKIQRRGQSEDTVFDIESYQHPERLARILTYGASNAFAVPIAADVIRLALDADPTKKGVDPIERQVLSSLVREVLTTSANVISAYKAGSGLEDLATRLSRIGTDLAVRYVPFAREAVGVLGEADIAFKGRSEVIRADATSTLALNRNPELRRAVSFSSMYSTSPFRMPALMMREAAYENDSKKMAKAEGMFRAALATKNKEREARGLDPVSYEDQIRSSTESMIPFRGRTKDRVTSSEEAGLRRGLTQEQQGNLDRQVQMVSSLRGGEDASISLKESRSSGGGGGGSRASSGVVLSGGSALRGASLGGGTSLTGGGGRSGGLRGRVPGLKKSRRRVVGLRRPNRAKLKVPRPMRSKVRRKRIA